MSKQCFCLFEQETECKKEQQESGAGGATERREPGLEPQPR